MVVLCRVTFCRMVLIGVTVQMNVEELKNKGVQITVSIPKR